jgi:hypothetical protein
VIKFTQSCWIISECNELARIGLDPEAKNI